LKSALALRVCEFEKNIFKVSLFDVEIQEAIVCDAKIA
jgi:hypothetical protein